MTQHVTRTNCPFCNNGLIVEGYVDTDDRNGATYFLVEDVICCPVGKVEFLTDLVWQRHVMEACQGIHREHGFGY